MQLFVSITINGSGFRQHIQPELTDVNEEDILIGIEIGIGNGNGVQDRREVSILKWDR